jgi:hypothetical protein
MNKITICCIKKGDKYGPEYVNILESMVSHNVRRLLFDFVCFTDNPIGISKKVRVLPLPFDAPGWWGKMGLYMPSIPGISTERLLFLDLDIVITGSIDEAIEWPSDHVMARDWPEGWWPEGDPKSKVPNSSVILLKIGSRAEIWEAFKQAGFPCQKSQQGWVNDRFGKSFDLFPDKIVQSYKLHRLENKVCLDCKIVMFHGKPKPPECGGWVKELWS